MPPAVVQMEDRLDAAVEVLLARAAERAAKKAKKQKKAETTENEGGAVS
jgi:hypothetical protein